ncbi:MAG: OmpA family protein [Saprospiraceae bacterium]|nr:OmpA family protein [Saprospiraceae bacterium]
MVYTNRKHIAWYLGSCFCFIAFVFGSCSLTKPVKTGEMAYAVRQYDKAIELLEEEYKNETKDASKYRKAYLLGQCNDILQRFNEALKWFDIADQYAKTDKSAEDLAYALKKNERYVDAEKLFSVLYRKTKDNTFRGQADICRLAAKKQNEEPNYDLEPFSVNTKYSEYSPAFFEDEFIVFSSDREGSTGGDTYEATGHSFSDLFVMSKRGRQVHNFDAVINSAANEGTVCFNKTFDEIFFTRCVSEGRDGQFCKIYYSKRFNGYWVEPEPIMFFDDKTNFYHPTLIENDSVLIFSAAPDGKSYDLFYSERIGDGWSEAAIMPSVINSLGNEKFPTAYNDTLFFASDGHPGFGGLDVFKTYVNDDGSWARPKNMGFPINSGADDFGLIVEQSFTPSENIVLEGFFTSSRNYSNLDDIFFFSIYPEEEAEEEAEEEETEEVDEEIAEYQIYLAGRVVEVVYQDGDPNKEVTGKNPISNAFLNIETPDSTFSMNSDSNGRFLFEANSGQYKLIAKMQGFLSDKADVIIPDRSTLKADTTINIEIDLDKIVYDAEIVIPNIYYDYNKWNVRDDAKPSLNSLEELLVLNPRINIELGSHTDCRGEDDFNLDLSQKRAQSVVTYLTQNGISGNRLKAVGYGETNFAIDCNCADCTEEQHQINRRTTFKIIQ